MKLLLKCKRGSHVNSFKISLNSFVFLACLRNIEKEKKINYIGWVNCFQEMLKVNERLLGCFSIIVDIYWIISFNPSVDVGELELVAVDAVGDGRPVQDAVLVIPLLLFAAEKENKMYFNTFRRFYFIILSNINFSQYLGSLSEVFGSVI